ncbi:MAG: polymerase [Candidatus Hydrogenedentes bacterium]|nr:polymerase [Candidatus Hydrogenedentota bacterium]
MPDRLFLIDGTAFAYRSFFGVKGGLTDSKGRPTNAAYGFTRVLLKIIREQDPSHLVVVFDVGGKNFRHELYPAYKANRPPTPPDLRVQFPMMQQVVEACNIPMLMIPEVEADDVLGTLARRAEAEGIESVIVTGDKDLLQLVTDSVTVYDPNKGDTGLWYTPGEVRERFGVDPPHVVDTLALMGDSSDNVPGVPGIGEKTARTLLEQYGTVEGTYAHLDEIKGKQRERLEQNRELAFLSRELVTIKTDVELDVTLESCRRRPLDHARLAELFAELEFQSLQKEFLPDAAEKEDLRYTLILTRVQLEAAIAEMRASGRFAVDTETTSIDPMRASLVGVSMSCEAETGYYIPIGHDAEALMRRENPDDLFPMEVIEPLPAGEALDLLRPLLEDPAVGKVGHNIKYDLIVFARAGIRLRGIVMDTMVASYLTDPSRFRHNMDEVSLQYLRRKTIPIADLIGKGSKARTFDTVPVDSACEYACEDADITWRLAEKFDAFLNERQLMPLFDDIELPLIGVLARMEMAGIALDLTVFKELHHEIEGRLKTLEGDIFNLAGESFQINSPKQLQGILFDKLGLAPGKKTKTGYSTDVEVLEELADEHPLPKLLLEYRILEKLRGTYVDTLPKLVHPETGRVHTSFNQAVAATGRLSSSDPNLQNIPVRTEMGRRIRQGFVPGGPGMRLISADYSQIELRILAHLSGDESLIDAFRHDADIHRETAARAFGVSADAVTAEMRHQAKAINFGVVYGISAFGLARNLGISNADAAHFIERYFAQYPRVRQWLDETVERAAKDGYVTTLFNRRRYISELGSSNVNTRKGAERIAVNTPVQGSAADIIKLAMVRLDAALEGTGARLLLQVHDELLVEGPAKCANETAETVRRIMENVIQLDVPMKVDIGIGMNWAEIH